MSEKIKWTHAIYVFGVIGLIVGALDPLEGSVTVAVGSIFIAVSTYITHDRHWKIFLTTMIMTVFGVVALFYISSLGGFGGKSTLSWWWGVFILPYPLGWLMNIATLIARAVKNKKLKVI